MILVIDNYDSFTYNLVQYIGEFNDNIKVVRNDALTVAQIKEMKVERIVISPGPGRPKDAGVSVELVQQLYKQVPILGVCLGHQVIGEAFGGSITYADKIMHGKVSTIKHDQSGIYAGVPSPCQVTRYHSLVIEPSSMPKDLQVTTCLDDGTIMSIRHVDYPVVGIQFHPESILTEHGKRMIQNFLDI